MIMPPRTKWSVCVLPLVALLTSDPETNTSRLDSSNTKLRPPERVALDDTISPPARQGRAKIIDQYVDEFSPMHGDAKPSDFGKKYGPTTRRPTGALTGPPKLTKGTGTIEPTPRKRGMARLPRPATGDKGLVRHGKPVAAPPQAAVTGSDGTQTPPAGQGRAKIIDQYVDEFSPMHGDAKPSDFGEKYGPTTRRPTGALTGPPKLTKGKTGPPRPKTARIPKLTKGTAGPRRPVTARLPQRLKGTAGPRRPAVARLPQRIKGTARTKTRKPRTARSHTFVKKPVARSRARPQHHPVRRGISRLHRPRVERQGKRTRARSIGRRGNLGRARARSIGRSGSLGGARVHSMGRSGMHGMRGMGRRGR